jgi:hypothetical protein
MKNQPTYDDANLILRLYELRREDQLRAARKWMGAQPPFVSREQWLTVCPPGSDTNAWFRMVTSYWEMAATFVATGVLNGELFYRGNNLEMLFVWQKVKALAEPIRQAQKNALYWRNLEDVAESFIRYMNENAPGWYEQFAAAQAAMIK